MGEVISLEERRRVRVARLDAPAPPDRGPEGDRPEATFFFDLASAGTYLAVERAEQLFAGLTWRPALSADGALDARAHHAAVRTATTRAAELRMPLVWPERYPAGGRSAMRVASFAAERGQAPAFVLAASRLAFCGGFDLDDPEILAEAAAAAALPLDDCLRAARDRGRDRGLEAAGRELVAAGADQLPVLRVGRRLFCGEQRLSEAAAAMRDPRLRERPERADEFVG